VRETLTSRRAWALVALAVLSALGSYALLNAGKDPDGGRRTSELTMSAGRSGEFRTGAGFDLDPGPVAAAVRWRGGRLDGVVYFTAGPDELSPDVYRVEGPLADAKRLTRSSVNFGIGWMTGRPGQIVVSSGRAGGLDHVESLEQFQRASSDPGVRGSSPALDTDGTLAYIVNSPGHGLDLIVKPPDGLVRRIRHVPQSIPVWGPGHRLYVADSRRLAGSKRRRPVVIVGFGSQHPRIVRLPGRRVDGIIAVSKRGDIASFDKRGHLTITPRSGRSRQFKLPWIPLTWSPDARRLLVLRAHDHYNGGHQVGLLNPPTGDIKPIGSITGGQINSAIWLPSD
jgi:hypothetical protein